MWYCVDCNGEFDNPVKAVPNGAAEGDAADTCPLCGSDDIEEEFTDEDWA